MGGEAQRRRAKNFLKARVRPSAGTLYYAHPRGHQISWSWTYVMIVIKMMWLLLRKQSLAVLPHCHQRRMRCQEEREKGLLLMTCHDHCRRCCA